MAGRARASARHCASLAAALGLALGGLRGAGACHIQGVDSGICEDPEDFERRMPFCKDVVNYRACLPRFEELFGNHTVRNKDTWVAQQFKSIVSTRIGYETSEALQDAGVTETGEPGEVTVRFFENPDCENAYRNFFCWLNFPRCDDEDNSLILCRSVCENFFDACEYDSELWRCGDPIFYGGAEAEVDDVLDDDGLPIYWRTMLPGQPFRDNEVDEEDNPIVVCTPSIKNAAPAAVHARGGGLARLVRAVSGGGAGGGVGWAAVGRALVDVQQLAVALAVAVAVVLVSAGAAAQ